MTSDKKALSPEQLEKLNDGESIGLDYALGGRQLELYPPCEDSGHNWSRYDIRQKSGDNPAVFSRRCSICGCKEDIEVDDLDYMFDFLVEAGGDYVAD